MENKPIVIDYKEINRAIQLMSRYKQGFYDPTKQVYVLDGFEITEKFLNDTLSKMSHYMNAVSNMRIKVPLGSVDDYKNAIVEPPNKIEMSNGLCSHKKIQDVEVVKEQLPPVLDTEGNPIKYE